MPLLILFILVPALEIYLLISIGGVIGAGTTLVLIVLTAVIGSFLIRRQGMQTLQKAQAQMRQSQLPAREMFEGVALLLAGAFLMTPGFFTDALGFLLLVPPFRQFLISRVSSKAQVTQFGETVHKPQPHQDRVIEAEYEEVETKKPK